MKIRIYPEMCCDECNEVIHNHMDCPACKGQYAGTDQYGDMYGMGTGHILTCEDCKTKFRLISNHGLSDDSEWEQINEAK